MFLSTNRLHETKVEEAPGTWHAFRACNGGYRPWRLSRLTFDNTCLQTSPEPACSHIVGGQQAATFTLTCLLDPIRQALWASTPLTDPRKEGVVKYVLRTDAQQLLADATSRQGPGSFFVSLSLQSPVCRVHILKALKFLSENQHMVEECCLQSILPHRSSSTLLCYSFPSPRLALICHPSSVCHQRATSLARIGCASQAEIRHQQRRGGTIDCAGQTNQRILVNEWKRPPLSWGLGSGTTEITRFTRPSL